MARNDFSLLEAALLGYQTELQRIQAAIADVRKRLGHPKAAPSAASPAAGAARKRHRISAEGRRRIAEAQKKRWAAKKKAAA